MVAPLDENHSFRPLNCLLKRGCAVVFMSYFNPFPEGQEGFKFIRFPKPRGGRVFPKLLGQKFGSRLFRLLEWTTVLRLKVLYRRIRPAIVHVHWVDEHAYYYMKAGLRPLVLTVWGSDINIHFLPDTDPIARHRVGEALACADLILIDSADMHKKCAKLAGHVVPTKLFTLGIDIAMFRPGYAQAALEWRSKLNIPAEATVLLSNRGWKPLYRHDCILEAFAQAMPRLNSKAILVFKILKKKGTDQDLYEKEMRGQAEQLGVTRMVRWMAEVPMNLLPELYSFADVILNYPSMDAFPVTFLESAACECPVISCRLPAYVDTFADEYFHLVSPDNLSELSEAIVDFVNHKREPDRERLTELRRIMCRDYDEKKVSDRLIEIYSKLHARLRQ